MQIYANRRCAAVLVILFGWIALNSLYAAENGEKTKTYGLITGRTGDILTIKTADRNVTVVITDETKVQKPKGLGLRKAQMSFTALIPGLKISVDGVRDEQNRIAANTITFQEMIFRLRRLLRPV
jgi:hypothetical protein